MRPRRALWLSALAALSCDEPTRPVDVADSDGGIDVVYAAEMNAGGWDRFGFAPVALDASGVYAVLGANLGGGGGIAAFDRETGEVRWAVGRPANGPANLSVAAGSVLFVGSVAIALDAATGAERWRFDPGANGSIAVSAVRDAVLYFGTDSVIWARDVGTGESRWRSVVMPDHPFRTSIRGVTVDDDAVYANIDVFLGMNGVPSEIHVVALSRDTGTERWRFVEGGGSFGWHIPAWEPRVTPELVYVGDIVENTIIALERETGVERWRWRGAVDGSAGPQEPPHIIGDTLVGSSGDGSVFALDRRSGALLWHEQLGGSVFAAAPCGGRILANLLSLHVLGRRSGRLLATDALHVNDSAQPDFLNTRFTVDGRDAWILSDRVLYRLRCPD